MVRVNVRVIPNRLELGLGMSLGLGMMSLGLGLGNANRPTCTGSNMTHRNGSFYEILVKMSNLEKMSRVTTSIKYTFSAVLSIMRLRAPRCLHGGIKCQSFNFMSIAIMLTLDKSVNFTNHCAQSRIQKMDHYTSLCKIRSMHQLKFYRHSKTKYITAAIYFTTALIST